MLETRFPRPAGDLGNPVSWGVPTELAVVAGIGPEEAVQGAEGLRAGGVLQAFLDAGRKLEKRGVGAITTSCGFLVLLQGELQRQLAVLVDTSSLTLLPALLEEEEAVGVLTISAERLGVEHLRSAGVRDERLANVIIEGMPADSGFSRAILGNRSGMDFDRVAHEVVAAAVRLQVSAPTLKTLVLECTNMPPYAERIRAATGLRVLSLLDSPVLRAALAAGQLAA